MSHPLGNFCDVRILHTSDWHLGRNFHGVQLLDAQIRVIDAMVQMVKAEAVDVVVIAGDIYDRPVPSAEAVRALDYALAELRGTGARIIGISGNHDSADRIGFGEKFLTHGGVTLRGDVRSAGQAVMVPERSGDSAVAFYPVPYLEPESARHHLNAPEVRSHEKLLRLALDRARIDLDVQRASQPQLRSVAIVHAFVTGGQESDSELALSLGGSAEVPLKALLGFDYTALGHLHGRQSLGKGNARYSGSLLPYSFSERNHVKGSWLIDLPEHGEMTVTGIDYPVVRRLHQLRGTVEELLVSAEHAAAEGSYVHAIVTDSLLPMEPMAQLRRRFPHIVHLEHTPPARTAEGSYVERTRGKDDLDITVDFFADMAGRQPTEAELADLTTAIKGLTDGHKHNAA